MFKVYALISRKAGRIYVGITSNLGHRIREHNTGRTKSTKGYRPWELLHFQVVENRIVARELEKKWKSGAGKEYLKIIDKLGPCSSVG